MTHTLTATGDTYSVRNILKDDGWTWDADSKSWSIEVTDDVNSYSGDAGYAVDGCYYGTLRSIAHNLSRRSGRVTVAVTE